MVISSVINLCMFEDISLESFRLKIELFGENFKRHNKILFFFTLISFHFFLQAKTFKKKVPKLLSRHNKQYYKSRFLENKILGYKLTQKMSKKPLAQIQQDNAIELL